MCIAISLSKLNRSFSSYTWSKCLPDGSNVILPSILQVVLQFIQANDKTVSHFWRAHTKSYWLPELNTAPELTIIRVSSLKLISALDSINTKSIFCKFFWCCSTKQSKNGKNYLNELSEEEIGMQNNYIFLFALWARRCKPRCGRIWKFVL